MIKYYPYPSDKPNKKFFIITDDNRRIYFGQAGATDMTIHKNEAKKQLYINRHRKREEHLWNKSGINSPSFWSRFLLWNKPTIKESYQDIKNRFLS